MNLNSKLINALNHIAPTSADEYMSGGDTYIVFNYNSNPDDFGDDIPGHEIVSIQVHLFCPSGVNSLKLRQDIKRSLVTAGFSWPAYINASDHNGQHHVFECQMVESAEVE